MALTLNDDEAKALRRALDNYLPELAYEVARIDLMRERHDLAQFEQILIRLRRRLVEEQPTAPSP